MLMTRQQQLYHIFLKTFARKEEVAALRQDMAEFREETQENFKQVDQRLDGLRAEMRQGFQDLAQRIEQLGARWGIRSESLFRETMVAILEKSFDTRLETRHIEGEQFDLIITNGHHILVEIAASAPPNIVQRLERKRELYTRAVGMAPTRFIFAVASIHSRRAEALREADFEVIEPEE